MPTNVEEMTREELEETVIEQCKLLHAFDAKLKASRERIGKLEETIEELGDRLIGIRQFLTQIITYDL